MGSRNGSGLAAAGILAALLLLAAAGAGWRLQKEYERGLIARVWPESVRAAGASVSGTGPPTVLLLGDSRLARWDFPGAFPGRIVNAGVSGGTTAELLAKAPALLAEFRPDAVVIEAGINDLKLLGVRPDLRSKVTAAVRDNLGALVAACRRADSKVLLLTIWPPTRPEPLRWFVWNRAVPESVAEINRSLAARFGADPGVAVVDLFAGGVRPVYRDALHLDPGTYRELTPLLERHIGALLGRP